MCWNVQGIFNKLLLTDFVNFCSNYDIFSCSEIHNCSEDRMKNSFPKYNIYVSYRDGFKGGGVAVFVKKCLFNVVKEIKIDLPECKVFNIDRSYLNTDQNMICCFPYIPHYYSTVFENSHVKGLERLFDLYDDINSTIGEVYWLIGGDLNSRVGKLDDFIRCYNLHKYLHNEGVQSYIFDENILPRKTRDLSYTNTYGEQLTQFCRNNGLYMLNGRTNGDLEGNITCIANKGKSIVDYIIVSNELSSLIQSFSIIPRPESDHFPICATLKVKNTLTLAENEIVSCHPINKIMWKADKSQEYYNNIDKHLCDSYVIFQDNIKSENIDSSIDILNSCISKASKCMQSHRKLNVAESTQPLWWDDECQELKTQKYKCLDTFHFSNEDRDLELYLQSKKSFKNLCKSKQKEYDKYIINDLALKANSKNSRSFWSLFKKILTKPANNSSSITPAEWYCHFKNLLNINGNFEPLAAEDDTVTDQNGIGLTTDTNEHFQELNDNISNEEVQRVVNKLKGGKANGSNGIPAEFLKINSNLLNDYLRQIFNTIFDSGQYPSIWSQSLIFPLHKKGCISDVNNFRGISLLNIDSKLFSSVIYERLIGWAESNHVIPESQAGSRRGYSTIDNIFCLQALVNKYISKKGGRFFVLFIDFSKAYDNVDRSKLWKILKEKGLHGKILQSIKSMYSTVLSSVRIGRAYTTDSFQCFNGLKQGCVLSTFLFSLYVSKLESMMRDQNLPGIDILSDIDILLLMYIDDLCIFSDNVIDLQRKINTLKQFCDEWGMKVNLSKTKIMVFRNGGILKNIEKWYYGKDQIEVVSYYSYLGLVISSRLIWSKCVDNLSSRAQQIVSRMRYICNRYDELPRSMLMKIFDTKVKPIILYGSEIWGVKKHEDIENVHIRYCKVVLNLGKTTLNFSALGELGRHPLYVDYHCRAIKYWYKLLTMPEQRYNHKCYQLLYRLDASGRINWASEIRSLLCCLGFSGAWYSQTIGNFKLFIKEVRDRLISTSYQEWYERVDHLAPEYLNYHPYPFVAPYINIIHTYRRRRIFALLRTFSLPIKNNMLKWNRINNNLCEKCNGTYVENEYHVLFRCTAYRTAREKYLPYNLVMNPNLNKLYSLLATSNEDTINSTISFLQEILKDRLK